VVHSDEMKVALIVGDEESRQVAGSLPQDFKDRICGAMGECGVGLTVALNNICNSETHHAAIVGQYSSSSVYHGSNPGEEWTPISPHIGTVPPP